MATDSYKRVYFNDGEGLTFGDLNDIQTFIQSQLWDGFYQRSAPGLVKSAVGTMTGAAGYDFDLSGTNATDVSTAHAFALKGGAAYPVVGSGNNKVKITPGTLFQKVGTTDGSTPTFLPYTFTGAEEVTIANGDATNPRVDLVLMRLELVANDSQTRDFKDATTGVVTSNSMSKKHRVQCTLTVLAGTPAAVPTFPTVTAGYVPICAVYVGTNWAAAQKIYSNENADGAVNPKAYLMDLRMPMTVKSYAVGPDQIFLDGTSVYRHPTGSPAIVANANNVCHVLCPNINPGARVIGVTIIGSAITTGRVALFYTPYDYAYLYNTTSIIYMNQLGLPGAGTTQIDFAEFQATQRDNTYTNTIAANAAGFGPPVWCGAARAVAPHFTSDISSQPFRLGVIFEDVDNATQIKAVIFHVAE